MTLPANPVLPDDIVRFIDSLNGKAYVQSYLIAVLQKIQNHFGYLPRACMDDVSRRMQIPAVKVTGVATFYHFFSFEPKGRNRITICLGTACYVRGAGKVLDRFHELLNLPVGQLTTGDGEFTVECARCLGACALAPVVVVNDRVHANVATSDVEKIIKICRGSKRTKSGNTVDTILKPSASCRCG